MYLITLSKINLAVPGVLAHSLQCRTKCKIQNDSQGAPKWPMGSGLTAEIVVTNVIAIQPPKGDPNATPTARAYISSSTTLEKLSLGKSRSRQLPYKNSDNLPLKPIARQGYQGTNIR